MEASEKQLVIYDTWENQDVNLVIQAVAGSGKTTTLLELLRRCEYRTLFLAFNKSIQTEIQSLIDSQGIKQGKALTMHSMGLQAIRKKYKFKINNYKSYDLVKAIQNEYYSTFKDITWEDKAKFGYTLRDMNDVSRIYLTNDISEIKRHMMAMDNSIFDVYVDGESLIDMIWNDFVDIRNDSYDKRFIEIDFHDMIYLPILKDLTIPIYPYYLMVDEAQDLNLVQHRLIDKLLSQGTIKKWIAVGDKNQAIYGFSGAHGKSFDMFTQRDNTIELPLDICYRCPVDIVASANEVYNVMTPFKSYTGVVQKISDISQIKEDSMVVCRNSLPLFKLYFQLIAMNMKVHIKGEDIIGPITKFLKPYKYKTINSAKNKMGSEMNKINTNTDSGRFKHYQFKQNFDIFMTLSNHLVEDFSSTVEELLEKISTIFKQNSGSIVLCTIHKAKGLESDVVYILNEHLIPSKWAISEQQLIQEQNLKYVARTRAKEELYFIDI
jgi:DNA helicase II / ATP-dependent DNA helicase PcrA